MNFIYQRAKNILFLSARGVENMTCGLNTSSCRPVSTSVIRCLELVWRKGVFALSFMLDNLVHTMRLGYTQILINGPAFLKSFLVHKTVLVPINKIAVLLGWRLGLLLNFSLPPEATDSFLCLTLTKEHRCLSPVIILYRNGHCNCMLPDARE